MTILGEGQWTPAPWINVIANPAFGFVDPGVLSSGYKALLDPCIPCTWQSFEIVFRYHSMRYDIVVENLQGVARGVSSVALAGAAPMGDGMPIPLADDSRMHQARPLYEGLNIVNPLLAVTPMSTQVQKYQEKYEAVTKDLQAVLVEMVLNYRPLPERAPEVCQKIGVNFANVIILPAAQEVLKANTALHVANEILRQRPKIKLDVQETLATWLAKYGVELKEAALANIRFDKAYEKAIEDKQIEEQRAEQKLYELTQAQRQAEIVAATAKGKGDAARAQAEGEADALRTKGEAEATYNAKVAASLTPTLIQQQYLMRWNGQLPQYMLGGDNSLLLQVPGGIQK